MAFVLNETGLVALDKAPPAMPLQVAITDTYTESYAALWRSQPQLRTVVSFLARNIAQLGLQFFRRLDDSDRERLNPADHPLPALFRRPNPWTTTYRLVDALVNDLGIYDNAYWAKVRLQGWVTPVGVVRLDPRQVVLRGDNAWGAEFYRFKGKNGDKDFPADEIVHFRGYNPTNAREGSSPVETLRRILAEEYQAGQYREQLWRNGARMSGFLTRPVEAPRWSAEARSRFSAAWRSQWTGDGSQAGGTPLLEEGMGFTPTAVTPEQAQYLEARKLTREEVAAAYHIPLPMVGILDHATFSNITEQHKNLYQDTLGPWLQMIVQELDLQLFPDFPDSDDIYAEFNLNEKMRGSFEEQAAQLQTSVGAPWVTRNEARARMNLPAVEGGDELVTPLNVLIGGQASPTDSAPDQQDDNPPAPADDAEESDEESTGQEAEE